MAAEFASQGDNIFTRYRRGQKFNNDEMPVRVKVEKITLASSKQMVLALNKQFQEENPKENTLAINIKAITEEARRVRKNLKLMQPKDKNLSNIEIKNLKDILKHWGNIVADVRMEIYKNPNLLTGFDQELIKKLHLQKTAQRIVK